MGTGHFPCYPSAKWHHAFVCLLDKTSERCCPAASPTFGLPCSRRSWRSTISKLLHLLQAARVVRVGVDCRLLDLLAAIGLGLAAGTRSYAAVQVPQLATGKPLGDAALAAPSPAGNGWRNAVAGWSAEGSACQAQR